MENKDIINSAVEISQKVLDKGDRILPMCLIYNKDNSCEIIGLSFDGNSKEQMRFLLKKYLLNKPNMEKYAIVFDTKMTKMDMKGKDTPEVNDVVLVSIYSSKSKIGRGYVYHEDKKLITKPSDVVKFDGRKKNFYDCWDIWGEETPIGSKINEEYNKFKQENPEKYKGVD